MSWILTIVYASVLLQASKGIPLKTNDLQNDLRQPEVDGSHAQGSRQADVQINNVKQVIEDVIHDVNPFKRTQPEEESKQKALETQGAGDYGEIWSNNNWEEPLETSLTTEEPNGGNGYVIDGWPAGRGKWPWVVALDMDIDDERIFGCGGVLIQSRNSSKFVLTAAHCVDYPGMVGHLKVSVGIYNLTEEDEVERIPVSAVYVHEDFDASKFINDIAVLQLAWQPDTSNPDVEVLSLPNSWNTFLFSRNCYITGWGVWKLGSNPELSEVLLERNVSIITNKECQRRWAESPLSPEIVDSHICIDEIEGASSCQGDSGSPLHCQMEATGEWSFAGITSWGSRACHSYPAVYTRVTSHLDWINSVTGRWNRPHH